MAKILSNYNLKDFFSFLKAHKRDLLIFTIAYTALYLLLTYLYPLPSTLVDSANYVYCAKVMKIGGFRPFGYSWYINFIHGFSSSLGFLIFSQFFLTALSTLFFLFTVKYFFRPATTWLWYVFTGLVIVAPTTLYIANSLLSDSLFCSLTIIWLTASIWIIYSRSFVMVVVQLLAMFWAMEVRYTGAFYPLLTALIFFLSFKHIGLKLGLSTMSLLVLMYFFKSTKNEMKREFGVEIFSGFSGWTNMNNVMHVLPYADIKTNRIRDGATKNFYEFLLSYDPKIYERKLYTHFMWSKESPLKKYLYYKMQTERLPYVQAWLLSAKDFEGYAGYFIKKYPFQYFQHYIVPNSLSVIYPPTNQGFVFATDEIVSGDLFQEWFGMKNDIKFTPASSLYKNSATFIVLGNLLICVAFIATLVLAIIKRKTLNLDANQLKVAVVLIGFVLLYMAFSAYAAPYEIRYGIPMRPVLLTIPFLFWNIMLMKKSESV